MPCWRCRTLDRFEPLWRKPVEESTSLAGDRWSDHQFQFVDHACSQQRLSDRDAGVDADVAARLVAQLADELDESALDDMAVRPFAVQRSRGHHELGDAVDERRKRLHRAL